MSTDGTSAPWDPSVRSDPGVVTAAMLADPDLPPEVLLARALEPFLYLDEVTPVTDWGGPHVVLYLEVRGYAKWRPGDLPERADAKDQRMAYELGHRARSSLFERAERAVEAAEVAGFTHERHPVIEADGNIQHGRKGTGEPDVLLAKVTVRMSLVPPS